MWSKIKLAGIEMIHFDLHLGEHSQAYMLSISGHLAEWGIGQGRNCRRKPQ